MFDSGGRDGMEIRSKDHIDLPAKIGAHIRSPILVLCGLPRQQRSVNRVSERLINEEDGGENTEMRWRLPDEAPVDDIVRIGQS